MTSSPLHLLLGLVVLVALLMFTRAALKGGSAIGAINDKRRVRHRQDAAGDPRRP